VHYEVISTDCHILEPPNLWIDRLPKEWQDRAPRVLPGADGGDGWSWDGKPPNKTFGLEVVAGRSTEDYRNGGLRWDEVMPGCYDGAAHVKDMAEDHVDASVLYPAVSVVPYSLDDKSFALACMKAYNDWLADEFCAADPDRLIGLFLIPVDHSKEEILAEVERMIAKGAKAFFIPGYPARAYHDPYYDDLWRVLEQAGTPVSFHRSHGGKPPASDQLPTSIGAGVNLRALTNAEALSGQVVRFFAAIAPFTNMIFSGTFGRFPGLKVVAGEVNCGWAPFWLQMLDQTYEVGRHWAELHTDRVPSEYFGENVFVTALDDYEGYRRVAENESLARGIMYSTDYPHAVTLWPRTRELLPKLLDGVSEAAQRQILADNAVRVFNLNGA
jgi:predicted TIM-barrel fold metal-dependent hydrolase